MQIIGYSLKDWRKGQFGSCFSEYLKRFTESEAVQLSAMQPSGKREAFCELKFVDSLVRESTAGVSAKGYISCVLDARRHSDKKQVFPFSICELNLYKITGLDMILNVLKSIIPILEFDMAFITKDEDFIKGYNVSPLGIGVGLLDVYWINYFGDQYTEILSNYSNCQEFYMVSELLGNDLILVTKKQFEEHQQMSTNERVLLKEIVGGKFFSNLETGIPGMGSSETVSRFILSNKVISSIARSIFHREKNIASGGQAKVVPGVFKLKN